MSEVVWHVIGHSRYGSMGVSAELLGCLETHDIKAVIHSE